MYDRFVAHRIEEALSDTPVVLIVGPRRAGKTTLRNVSTFSQQIGAFFYVTTSGSSVLTGVGTVSKLSGSARTCSAG